MPPDAPYAPPLSLNPALLNRIQTIQQKGRLLRHGSPRAGYWLVL
jgi:hypothetical protein